MFVRNVQSEAYESVQNVHLKAYEKVKKCHQNGAQGTLLQTFLQLRRGVAAEATPRPGALRLYQYGKREQEYSRAGGFYACVV